MRAADWLQSNARLRPDKAAVVDVRSGLRLTYAELDRRASRLAGALQRSGVEQGDRVALLAPNSVSHLELLFACGKVGALFVPLNMRFSQAELLYVLEDCQPRMLVFDEGFARQAQELATRYAAARLLAPAEYEEIVTQGDSSYRAAALDMEDPWAIIYTGGTTGKSKGAILSHRAITWNSINTIVSWGLTESEVTPVYLPMFHTGGLNALVMPVLHAGGTVVIPHEVNPQAIVDVLERECCTIALFVPTVYHLLIHSEEFADAAFSTMHTFLSGGAPCPHTIYQAFHAKGIQFKEGYGLTEAGPNNFYIHPDEARVKVGSVGKAMFHNEIRLVDDRGHDVPNGETGELWIRGPHVFSGYWNKPELTADAFAADGWLKTGDLCRRDQDGYHYIAGRKKDMIISGGENVYPLEIEHLLAMHPQVSEVAVVGLPHEKWGEVVTAVIVPQETAPTAGRPALIEELKAYCRKTLAGYKVPKQFLFRSDLPTTSVGKIDKKALVQQLESRKSG
ncbi:MAG TPA: long-chain fatty acid--CoA ligase [Bacilli bacterium]|nr:long-chain fatty acid--CoA ligase [Bacilli bacterium]